MCIYRIAFSFVFAVCSIQSLAQFSFEELFKLNKTNPDSTLKILQSQSLKSLSEIEKSLLFSEASELMANYKKSDSAISHALANFNFENDSDLYFQFIKVYADQKKIEDDFESSVKYWYELVNYATRQKDTFKIISTSINLGELYRATENFSLSLYYLQKAEDLAKSNTSKYQILLARAYGRRAAVFMQCNQNLDSVEVLSKKVIEIAKKENDLNLEAVASNELGYLYLAKNHKKAKPYLERAINIWTDLNAEIYTINAKFNLARYYREAKQPEKGIEILMPMLEQVNNSGWEWEKGTFYMIISELYALMNDYKKAYEYNLLYQQFYVDIAYKQYDSKLALLSNQLEVNERQKELIEKQKQIDLARIENKRNQEEKQFYLFLLVGAVIVAFFMLLLAILINNQRLRLRQQQGLIIKTNNKLSEAAEQKESLLREVNHRVKNNLSVLSGLLYLQQKELTNQEAISVLKESQVRINTIALIHESLYQREDMDKVDFQDYLIRLLGYIKSIYWEKENKVDFQVNCQNLKPTLNQSIPLAMILNELITNSFKYAFANNEQPIIGIEYNAQEKEVIYFDNGPGIGQNIRKGSLGLKLIEIFLSQLNAKIETKNESGYFVNKIIFN